MKIVVIGGTGLIGSKVVAKLEAKGHNVIAASPDTGVNTITREGLDKVLRGAEVVVDVSNSPALEGPAVMDFFKTSTSNLLGAETVAGVKHHVALSVVGIDRLQDSAYFQGKIVQERLIKSYGIPYTIVHATQFFEFVNSIAAAATDGKSVRLAPVRIQPMSADDVASAVAKAAIATPMNGIIEVAGPKEWRLDELVRTELSARHDPRVVMSDPKAPYFGAQLHERSLLPSNKAKLSATTFEDWLLSA